MPEIRPDARLHTHPCLPALKSATDRCIRTKGWLRGSKTHASTLKQTGSPHSPFLCVHLDIARNLL